MWTLLPRFSKPFFKTVSTSKLATGWAHHRIRKFTEAYETFEQFVKITTCLITHLAASG